MGYDVRFKVKVEGANYWINTGHCDANITWNVGKIIRLSTGLEWKNEANNGLCKDVIPSIQRGLNELYRNPDKYKPFESPVGWGTVEGTIGFFERILSQWEDVVKWEDPELINAMSFWIE